MSVHGDDATRAHETGAPGRGAAPTFGERWQVAVAWLVVGLPAAWGVAQVVLKSLALFR